MEEDIKKIFDDWGKDTVLAIQALLTAQRNVATGNLRRSIKYVLGENFIQFTMDEYGKYVDEGTKPHWAPISPFKKWASAKGLKPSVAYAVRASIAKKGTKPHRFFQVTIEKELERLLPKLDEGFIRFLDNRITLLNEQQ